MINIEDKLYTSTEVADILGVSLRSVYRYIEEDKLQAEVKTATGRHRFTKQNIIDFLYPSGVDERGQAVIKQQSVKSFQKVSQKEEVVKNTIPDVVEEPVAPELPQTRTEVIDEPEEDIAPAEVAQEPEEEPVDWLAKFREAARKFDEDSVKEDPVISSKPLPQKERFSQIAEEEPEVETSKILYFRSRLGGLKDLAQNIDKSSRNSGLDYAFTLNAGLSLYRAIKPFSLLHVYVRSKDKDFFERILMLTPSDENNAQLAMIVSDDKSLYSGKDELHGLFVVAKDRLLEDIREYGDEDLIEEAESTIK